MDAASYATAETECALLALASSCERLDHPGHAAARASCFTLPAEPPRLWEAVRWIAELGGFVGSRNQAGSNFIQIFEIEDEKVYSIIYTSEMSRYSTYLPVVEKNDQFIL
jgi:hypothetical protein